MSQDSWACLMVENGPGMLTDETRSALKRAACTMYRKKKEWLAFSSDECEGLLKTDWLERQVSSIAGVVFKSELDDLYQFLDLSTEGQYPN